MYYCSFFNVTIKAFCQSDSYSVLMNRKCMKSYLYRVGTAVPASHSLSSQFQTHRFWTKWGPKKNQSLISTVKVYFFWWCTSWIYLPKSPLAHALCKRKKKTWMHSLVFHQALVNLDFWEKFELHQWMFGFFVLVHLGLRLCEASVSQTRSCH